MKRKDHFYYRAKKENYPARSVYKLEEIDKKYHLISKGFKILDLGCYPGSWTKYCSRKIGQGGLVVGVDRIMPKEKAAENTIFLQQDIFQLDINILKEIVPQFDIILSDMAPNTTGTKFIDQARSLELVKQALVIVGEILKNGGNFVAKVFQGPDVNSLCSDMKQTFKEVKIIKPKGSRKESSEVYLLGYRLKRDIRHNVL